MSTQNLTTADAILKDLYVGPIVEQLNKKTYMIDQIDRAGEAEGVTFSGRMAIFPVHKGRNRGRGSRGDGGVLPTAGVQSYEDAQVSMRYHYQSIELSDVAIESSKSNEGAFVNLLDSEVKGAAEDMRKDVNRQVFGTGDGVLATFATGVTTATNTFTVDNIQYLHVGDPIDVRRKTDGTAVTGGTANEITALSTDGTVTVSSNITTGTITASQYAVYISGNRSQEMDGLRNIVNTGRTLHTINSATAGNEYWNGQVRSVGTSAGSTATAGETAFELIADDVGATGQGETSVYVTTRGIRRRLADTFQSQKRFNDARAQEIHGGYSAIMVASGNGEVPVVADDDCPKQTVFAIDKSALRWVELTSPGWMDRDGAILRLKPGSTAGTHEAIYQGTMRWYAALACVAPNRLGRLNFCDDDSATVTS